MADGVVAAIACLLRRERAKKQTLSLAYLGVVGAMTCLVLMLLLRRCSVVLFCTDRRCSLVLISCVHKEVFSCVHKVFSCVDLYRNRQ